MLISQKYPPPPPPELWLLFGTLENSSPSTLSNLGAQPRLFGAGKPPQTHKLQTLQIAIILTRPDYENNPELRPHLHRSAVVIGSSETSTCILLFPSWWLNDCNFLNRCYTPPAPPSLSSSLNGTLCTINGFFKNITYSRPHPQPHPHPFLWFSLLREPRLNKI